MVAATANASTRMQRPRIAVLCTNSDSGPDSGPDSDSDSDPDTDAGSNTGTGSDASSGSSTGTGTRHRPALRAPPTQGLRKICSAPARACEAPPVTDRTAELARHAAERAAVAHAGQPLDEVLASIAGIDLPRAVPAADLVAAVAALALPRSARSLAAALGDELARPLATSHPHVPVAFDLARIQGLGYYAGPCLQLHVRHDDGRDFALGDGGALLSDHRERMVTTGVGAELLAKLF